MIKTAIQLKAKIRNVSRNDSKVAMTMIRVFFMERFLERVSISAYKNQFVLKGGMLVSSLIGLNSRATMDIDATVQALPLAQEEIEKIIVEYVYRLMFEDRDIELQSYNIETLLAEKLQTILSRGLANTRARDFYDVYEITHKKFFEEATFKTAFLATCEKRGTVVTSEQMQSVLEDIESDIEMRERWNQFKKKNYYVEDLNFDEVMNSVRKLAVSFFQVV